MSDLLDRLATALADRYTIDREIGYGGMAFVFLAEDLKHHRKVAVKVLRPELAATLGTERFLREIEIAAQLNHPHILPLLDSGEAEGFLYYVMPYIGGDSLRERLNAEATLSLDAAVDIAKQIAGALEHAHRQDVLHRDIKPENVLFSAGLAVVTDFGIAKAVSTASREALTRSGFPLGTVGYMSPEQAAGNTALDPRTDICSLACVVYELLVGETPGVWTTPEEVSVGRFTMLSQGHRELLDRLPGRVEQALVKGLAMRPDERYATPADFANALATVSKPGEKLRDCEVRNILARAAEIDAEPTGDDSAFSMGGVERVAAEVGIAPDRVRAAARDIDAANPGMVLGGYLGVTGRIEFQSVVAADTSRPQYAAMLDEIRRTVGDAGLVNETFNQSFFWEGRLPTSSKRRVQVVVDPSGGSTRIRIAEFPGEDEGLTIVPPIVASVLTVGLVAATIARGMDPVVAFLIGGTVWGGHYAVIRILYRRFLKKRTHVLRKLLGRLSTLALGSGQQVSVTDEED